MLPEKSHSFPKVIDIIKVPYLKNMIDIESIIQYKFKNKEILKEAIIHRSISSKKNLTQHGSDPNFDETY